MYIKYNGDSDIMGSIDGFDLFNSRKLLELDMINDQDSINITRNEKRLDLLVIDRYNNYDYYGSIGVLNRIFSPDDLKIGEKLRLPKVSSLRYMGDEW